MRGSKKAIESVRKKNGIETEIVKERYKERRDEGEREGGRD